MYKILIIAVLFATTFTFNTAQADTTFNTRLLMHATHQNIENTGVGIAGWLVAPNITAAPDKWLGLIGPRYDSEGWNLELMAGSVINQGEATALVDFRLELTPGLFDLPIYIWGNLQWIDTGAKGTLYSYLQIDYKLLASIGLIGLETENATPLGEEGDWAVGPHLVIPLGKRFALIAAYQFHFGAGEGQQFWLRAVANI